MAGAINVRGVVRVAPGAAGHRLMLDKPITMMAGDVFSATYWRQ